MTRRWWCGLAVARLSFETPRGNRKWNCNIQLGDPLGVMIYHLVTISNMYIRVGGCVCLWSQYAVYTTTWETEGGGGATGSIPSSITCLTLPSTLSFLSSPSLHLCLYSSESYPHLLPLLPTMSIISSDCVLVLSLVRPATAPSLVSCLSLVRPAFCPPSLFRVPSPSSTPVSFLSFSCIPASLTLFLSPVLPFLPLFYTLSSTLFYPFFHRSILPGVSPTLH